MSLNTVNTSASNANANVRSADTILVPSVRYTATDIDTSGTCNYGAVTACIVVVALTAFQTLKSMVKRGKFETRKEYSQKIRKIKKKSYASIGRRDRRAYRRACEKIKEGKGGENRW